MKEIGMELNDMMNLASQELSNKNSEVMELLKDLQDGILKCSVCKAEYEISEGILYFLQRDRDLNELMLKELEARDQEAEDYDSRLQGRYYKEVVSTLGQLGDIRGKNVIEYACGTGRFTGEITKADSILAVDFSLASINILSRKLAGRKGVGLILGDASSLVTRDNYFDLALSTQFLEHIISEEKRAVFLRNVQRTLKNGGSFVCTAYHHDLRRRVKGLPKEGRHPSGIYYYYFGKKEIKSDFKKCFSTQDLKVIDITLPLEQRFGLSPVFAGQLSRFFEKLPIVNQLGHLILIKGVK
jgi:ubiquinone/menaquinone biosynthesis C-methylase UbiE